MRSLFDWSGALRRFPVSVLTWCVLIAGYTACVALGVYAVVAPSSPFSVLLLAGLILAALLLLSLFIAQLRRERRQFETALCDREEKYSRVFRYLPVWVSIRDLTDDTYVDANEQVLNDLGYRRDEIIGKTAGELQLFSSDDRARVQQALHTDGGFSEMELSVRAKNGNRFTVQASGERIVINGKPCLLVVAADISSRWRIEQALAADIAQLNVFIENSPVALAMFDREMRYLHISKRWLQNYHLENMDLAGKCHYDIFPEMPDEWRAAHRRGLNGEIVRKDEDRLIRRNGEVMWLRWEVRPWHQMDGSVGGIVVFSENITDRKRAEAAVAERDSMLQRIGELAKVGAAIWDVNTNEYYWSPMMLKIHEVEGDTIPSREERMNFFPAEVRPTMLAALKQLMEQGAPLDLELPVITAKGNSIWVHVQGYTLYENGKIAKVLGAYQDITARKQADIALRESEERFRQIADNIHEVFWIFDVTEQRVIYVSPAYESIWGRAKQDLCNNPKEWLDAIVPEDRQRIVDALASIAEDKRYQQTYRIMRPDGGVRWIRDQAYAVMNADGHVSRIVGTAEDITESRLIELQLRQSQRLEAIGTLTGGIAHDFNNILAGIIGFTALAQQVADTDSELASYLAQIDKASRRAADLVSQILTFSRARGPELELVNMNELTSEAIKLLRAAIPSSIEFETYAVDDLPRVRGNASQLHQVIMNLATNAWQAMRDQKGQLQISLDLCDVDEAQSRLLSNIAPGQYVRLAVQDNGCGMDSETMERAFEPFFTTKPAGQGTGLGLSVVHGIVRNHRGAVRIVSEVNCGTLMEVFLPAQPQSEVTEPATASKTITISGTGRRILFVDDEPALVQLGEHMLAALGYQVEAYQDATAALAIFRQQPGRYDLVMTDQTMPHMPGLEFAAAVHAIYPAVPVILVSGYTAGIPSDAARAAGVVTVLDKPYSRETLAAALERYLPQNR